MERGPIENRPQDAILPHFRAGPFGFLRNGIQ